MLRKIISRFIKKKMITSEEDEFLPHPELYFLPELRFDEYFSYTATYNPIKNEICFHKRYEELADEYFIEALDHEIGHWAQAALLNREEREMVNQNYHIELSEGKIPFLERINHRPRLDAYVELVDRKGTKYLEDIPSEYKNRNIDDATAKHMIEIFLDELQKQGRTRISALDVVYELGLDMMQVRRIMDSMKDDGVVRDD